MKEGLTRSGTVLRQALKTERRVTEEAVTV